MKVELEMGMVESWGRRRSRRELRFVMLLMRRRASARGTMRCGMWTIMRLGEGGQGMMKRVACITGSHGSNSCRSVRLTILYTSTARTDGGGNSSNSHPSTQKYRSIGEGSKRQVMDVRLSNKQTNQNRD